LRDEIFWLPIIAGDYFAAGAVGRSPADAAVSPASMHRFWPRVLEVIQETSAVILAALEPPTAEQAEMPDAELAKVPAYKA
jgi:hypothetical protein